MDPIEGVNLRELVEECHVIVKKEMKDRIELGSMWAKYWAKKAIEQHKHMLLTCGRSKRENRFLMMSTTRKNNHLG